MPIVQIRMPIMQTMPIVHVSQCLVCIRCTIGIVAHLALWMALCDVILCHATMLPLVVGDSPGGFRIGWPYYLETGCRIVWLYHTDRRLNLNQAFAAAVSGLFRLLWIDWNAGNKCWIEKPGFGRIGWRSSLSLLTSFDSLTSPLADLHRSVE